MLGAEAPPEFPPNPRQWRLHLKCTTLLNYDAVMDLETSTVDTKHFLRSAWGFMNPNTFESLITSQTIKSTQLSMKEIQMAVKMSKFGEIDSGGFSGSRLPFGMHGVNVFAVPEMRGRRHLITEPHLNAVINADTIPNVSYPTRLGRRQSLRYAAYKLQIDFEAFYDAIPLPVETRNNFVFRKGNRFFRLCTLPTGARWSVAVGQAVTWTIVDVDTPILIHTMTDNVLIAAPLGMEREFISATRRIVKRMKKANLLTSPERSSLEKATDDELLQMALQPNTFIGARHLHDRHLLP